jgi:hypothetical protein
MQPENIRAFKRLYVPTEKAIREMEAHFATNGANEKMVKEIIANCDAMIAMLPLEFPGRAALSPTTRILLVNLTDPEDEPQEIVEERPGFISARTPDNTQTLYEQTIHSVLQNWKFLAWNLVVHHATDTSIKNTYLPLTLAQAAHCMTLLPTGSYWQNWEKEIYVQCANQIGWYSYEWEQDTSKLEAALAQVEKGDQQADRESLSYIKDTRVRLLLKLHRPFEAYAIVREVLAQDRNYADFQEFKTDPAFKAWKQTVDERDKQANEAFLQMIKAEQDKVTNQFKNPENPLVIQHADVLNLIKQRMMANLLHAKQEEDFDEKDYTLKKWSVEKIAKFENSTKLRLPDELKAYLLEIGEGGEAYFWNGGLDVAWLSKNKKAQKTAGKPFPLTEDNVHDIGHLWGLKAWVYPHDTNWQEPGKIEAAADMETLFALPPDADITDGCFEIGYSSSQDPLYLVMNGMYEGEIWVDTLQYGADAGGCFAPASAHRLKFLAFMAESLLAHAPWTEESDQGSWM